MPCIFHRFTMCHSFSLPIFLSFSLHSLSFSLKPFKPTICTSNMMPELSHNHIKICHALCHTTQIGIHQAMPSQNDTIHLEAFCICICMIVSHFHAAIHSTHPILFVKRCKYKTNKYKFSGLLCRSSVTQCTWEWRCNCHNNDTLTNTDYKHMLSGYRLFEITTLAFWCVLSSYKYPQYIQIYNLRKLYIEWNGKITEPILSIS